MSVAPRVSVIMPTYNGEATIGTAIASILAQNFRDFELLVLDDGSTDGTRDRVLAVQDARLRLLSHPGNQGIAAATNTLFAAARGTYLILMDHDDYALPSRLHCQVAFLDSRPDLDGCGAGHVLLREKGLGCNRVRAWFKGQCARLRDAGETAAEGLFGGSVYNPTVCFRRASLNKLDLWFDPALPSGIDDDFYERLQAAGARFAILPQVLLLYRRHAGSASRRNPERGRERRAALALRALGRLLPDSSELAALHQRVVLRDATLSPADGPALLHWLDALLNANASRGIYSPEALCRVLARHWQRVCALVACHDLRAGLALYRAPMPLRPFTGSCFPLLYQWQKRALPRLLR